MPARPLPERFQVAFSFAGEQRALVRAIAAAVEARLGAGTVFFDEWYEHYLAGADADLKLQEIYGTRSLLAVVCVSARYGGKPWTQAEHEAIRARLMQARASADPLAREGILPLRVGDGEVPGILFNTIAPDVRGRAPEATAELIVERLRLLDQDVVVAPTPWWLVRRAWVRWGMALALTALVAAGLLWWGPWRPPAQPLAGTVLDAAGEPLAGVEIRLPEYGLATRTDDLGRFRLEVRVAPGATVTYVARHPGRKTREDYAAAGTTGIRFKLEPKDP